MSAVDEFLKLNRDIGNYEREIRALENRIKSMEERRVQFANFNPTYDLASGGGQIVNFNERATLDEGNPSSSSGAGVIEHDLENSDHKYVVLKLKTPMRRIDGMHLNFSEHTLSTGAGSEFVLRGVLDDDGDDSTEADSVTAMNMKFYVGLITTDFTTSSLTWNNKDDLGAIQNEILQEWDFVSTEAMFVTFSSDTAATIFGSNGTLGYSYKDVTQGEFGDLIYGVQCRLEASITEVGLIEKKAISGVLEIDADELTANGSFAINSGITIPPP